MTLVGRGGGLGFLISKPFKQNQHTSPDYSTFESVCVVMSTNSTMESVWRKLPSFIDRSRYSRNYHQYYQEMAKAKSDYYENMVSNMSLPI